MRKKKQNKTFPTSESTEQYLPKKPTPKFIPIPDGIDKEIQVEDGELFDFEIEVEPILQVLIGKCLVQSRCELVEEYEKQEYIQKRTEYYQRREFELVKLQRLEAARIRREKEKERRKYQDEQNEVYFKTMHKKLLAKTFAKDLVKGLKQQSLGHLQEANFLMFPFKKTRNSTEHCRLFKFNYNP